MEFWIPLVAALTGALIGSATSIITILIQGGRDDRRSLRELAATLALDDYKGHLELAKAKGGSVYPVAVYLAHHMRVLEAAGKGQLTAEKFNEIAKKDQELRRTIDARDPRQQKRE